MSDLPVNITVTTTPPPECPYCGAVDTMHGAIGSMEMGTGGWRRSVACPGPAIEALNARIASLERLVMAPR